MNRNPIKCDGCGRFLSYENLDSGAATIEMLTPDSAYTNEEFITLCKKCNTKEKKGNDNAN